MQIEKGKGFVAIVSVAALSAPRIGYLCVALIGKTWGFTGTPNLRSKRSAGE